MLLWGSLYTGLSSQLWLQCTAQSGSMTVSDVESVEGLQLERLVCGHEYFTMETPQDSRGSSPRHNSRFVVRVVSRPPAFTFTR